MAVQFNGTKYYIRNVGRSHLKVKDLNVLSDNSYPADGTNVTLAATSNIPTQRWSPTLYSGVGCKIFTEAGSTRGLNIISTSNPSCTIWPCNGNNNNTDSMIDLLTIDASINRYKIKMISKNLYLTVTGSSSLSYPNVEWKPLNGSNDQVWDFVDPNAAVTPPPPVSGNKLTYPTQVMKITQRHDDYPPNIAIPHGYNSTGSPVDYPIDEGCIDTGRSWMYCPCDEMEVVRVYGVGTTGTNTIWLRSTSPVTTPSGKFNIVMMVTHPEDDDLIGISVGRKFTRSQAMFREGGDGSNGSNSFGKHFHISVGKGDFIGPYGWEEKTNGAWVLKTTGGALLPTQAFYVDTSFTNINTNKGYQFITI